MSHVIWKYKSGHFFGLDSVEHVPTSWDWLPWIKAKRDREAQEQYVAMTYMVPGRGDSQPEILAPTQEAKVLALTYTPAVVNTLVEDAKRASAARTIAPFSSTAASQWSTSPLVRVQPKPVKDYVSLKREGPRIKLEVRPDRIKQDLKRAPLLIKNYRAQKQVLQDSRIFI